MSINNAPATEPSSISPDQMNDEIRARTIRRGWLCMGMWGGDVEVFFKVDEKCPDMYHYGFLKNGVWRNQVTFLEWEDIFDDLLAWYHTEYKIAIDWSEKMGHKEGKK